MSKPEFSRLPGCVKPTNYKIHLTPDLGKFKFSGECVVSMDIVESTSKIVCNANNLEVSGATLVTPDGENVQLSGDQITTCSDQETLTLALDQSVKTGPATVTYQFTGTLNDQMRGFYRSKYSVNGEDRYMAVTQFESTDARQAFPCWDEPAIKATFDITITGPKDRVILSNMPVKTESEADAQKTVTFETSPIMSTYLVAIVVGEFDYLEDKTKDGGVTVRVYTPPGKKDLGTFALECGVRAITFYNDFFGVPYPLSKYDMVAIPDFSAGAMENWGLVTYREVCILVDPVQTSTASKQFVAIVVCHETAHQWFGNLVTMEWWTHLWLNEGFASFMENLTTDALYPENKIWDQFVPNTMIEALKLDALSSSHAIEVPVGHPAEVDEIFDSISYNKGASVIRMLHNWIGNENFKCGMAAYLRKYAYSNCETPQLWAELEAASKLPIESVMKTWTEKMGFPLISVKGRQEGSDRILTLEQSKFTANGEADTTGAMWQVPISIIRGNSDEVTKVILDQRSMEVKLANIGAADWVKLNPNFVGFYRVVYDKPMLDQLCGAIAAKSLSHLDRLNVVDDIFSLIAAGRAPTTDGLRLLQSFQSEENYVVWNNINSSVATLSGLLVDQDCYADYKRFVRDLMSDIKTKITWDPKEGGEDHFDTLLRSLVISRLGRFGDEEIRAEAKRRFDLHANGTGLLNADIRSAVYVTVAAFGTAADFDTMLTLYRNTDLHEEKERILRSGLASFQEKALLTRALEFSISDEVRPQDSVHFISAVANNKLGRNLSWDFFKNNLSLLKTRYPPGFLIARLVQGVTLRFNTEEMADTVEQFFAEHPISGAERVVQQSIESIRLNSRWLSRDLAAIKTFLCQK